MQITDRGGGTNIGLSDVAMRSAEAPLILMAMLASKVITETIDGGQLIRDLLRYDAAFVVLGKYI